MRFSRILLVALALLPFALPASAQTPPASASPTCECFCKSAGGAVDQSSPLTSDACNAACSQNGLLGVAVCATDASQYPASDPFCYASSGECVKTDAKGRPIATWDTANQPSECLPGSHYCYPVNYADINLSFALGNVTTVSDLGNYIQVAYNVLLGIGTTIAIVMLMVGGFQYVLGAGAPEQLAKGKKRMKDAVIGLVLLMSAYVILFTVNPQLVKLQVPTLRMTKGIQILTPQLSCEYLTNGSNFPNGQPYAIDTSKVAPNKDGASDACGAVAPVTADNNGSPVPAGTTCQFSACDDPDARCAGTGKAASCAKCQEVVPGVLSSGLTASSAVCSQLKKADTPGDGPDPSQDQKLDYCFYTTDNNLLVSAGTAAFGGGGTAIISGGTCAELAIDCSAIQKCEDYFSGPEAENDITSAGMGHVDNVGDLTGQQLCSSDPCHAAKKAGGTSCAFVHHSIGGDDCNTK
jgi:hypothetical protein